jgi:hypothetical protein
MCRYILERMDNFRDDSDVEYPTPDSELDSPDMHPEFDYDPSPFYIDEVTLTSFYIMSLNFFVKKILINNVSFSGVRVT